MSEFVMKRPAVTWWRCSHIPALKRDDLIAPARIRHALMTLDAQANNPQLLRC